MIRIGFDPVLEAEQQHQELIKEVELYRMANALSNETGSKARIGFNFLASLGKQMVILGANLEDRFGNKVQSNSVLNSTADSDAC